MAMPLGEAHLHHRGADKRCSACYGRVYTYGTYGMRQRVTMQHYRGHDGCPCITRRFNGTLNSILTP